MSEKLISLHAIAALVDSNLPGGIRRRLKKLGVEEVQVIPGSTSNKSPRKTDVLYRAMDITPEMLSSMRTNVAIWRDMAKRSMFWVNSPNSHLAQKAEAAK